MYDTYGQSDFDCLMNFCYDTQSRKKEGTCLPGIYIKAAFIVVCLEIVIIKNILRGIFSRDVS